MGSVDHLQSDTHFGNKKVFHTQIWSACLKLKIKIPSARVYKVFLLNIDFEPIEPCISRQISLQNLLKVDFVPSCMIYSPIYNKFGQPV